MNAELLNYTPHEIVLLDPDTKNVLCTIPPQPESIRLQQVSQGAVSHLMGSHVIRAVGPPIFTGLSKIPPFDSSIIVSSVVAEYMAREQPEHCKDVFAPDTSPAGCVRDDKGRIVGTTQLVRYK